MWDPTQIYAFFFFFSRAFFRQPGSVQSALPAPTCSYAARSGSREGSAGSASSTTSLSVGCPSPPGCAGARQMPPSSVDASARCCAQLRNPHQRRCQPAVAAARSTGGARRDRTRTRRRRRSWASLPQRPPTSDGSTTSFCGPGRASSGYRASFRRRATSIAAPSRSRLPGCGIPSARRGDTSVTSQHSASPRLVAPYKTKSRRRPIVGRDPRRGGVQKPLLRHNAAFSANRLASDPHPRALEEWGSSRQQATAGACSTVIPELIDAGATGEGEAQASAQSDEHFGWRERTGCVCGDGTEPFASVGT